MAPSEWAPFLWPDAWHDAAKLDLIQGTPFNCAVGDGIAANVVDALHTHGIETVSSKTAPVTFIKDPRWPQVQTGSKGNADAGPTGNPWIDSNGFAIQVARAFAPDKPVWLTETPPAQRVLRPDDYRLAVCDAAAYGGRWLPSPDLEAWPHIVAAQKLFSAHAQWQQYKPMARLAVVSDFSGPHRDLALETLNLLTRLYVPFQIVPKSHTSGFAVVLDLDKQDAATDPWALASQTYDKLGRQNDLYRLWNGGSLNAYYTASADGGTALLQLINYAAHVPGEAVTAGVMTPYRSARIYTLDQPEGSAIQLHPVRRSVEIYLPPFSVYAAIELKR